VANGIPRQLQLLQMAQTLAEGFLIQFGEEIEGQIQAPEFRKVCKIQGGNLRNGVLAGIAIKRGRISIFSMGNPKGKTQVLAYMLTTLDNTSSPNSSSRQLVICCSSQRTFRLCMFSDILRQLHFRGQDEDEDADPEPVEMDVSGFWGFSVSGCDCT